MRYIWLFPLLILQSCSNHLAYETLRNSQKTQCLNLPLAQYDECMDNLNDSYNQYLEQRRETPNLTDDRNNHKTD